MLARVQVWSSLVVLTLACSSQPKSSPVDEEPLPEPKQEAVNPTAERVEQQDAPAEELPTNPEKDWGTYSGFNTPDSVVFDDKYNRFLITNTGGDPWNTNQSGSISIIDRTSGEVTHKWIDGEADNTKLNAPRGIALSELLIFVVDQKHIRIFDRKTGAQRGSFEVPGARLLDDIHVTSDGSVFLTDSAWGPEWEPLPGSAIYQWKNGVISLVLMDDELHHPSGLTSVDGNLWVLSSQKAQILQVHPTGGIQSTEDGAGFGQRGIVVDADGDFLISSSRKTTLWKGTPGAGFRTAAEVPGGAGGIGYDSRRNRVVLALQEKNHVHVPTIR